MLRTGVFDMLNKNNQLSTNIVDLENEISINRLDKISSIEWLGQMVASLCWIISVFSYGISTNGDWLQLVAASSWMASNIASIIAIKNG
tara:strand:+ start:33 stop:299 length:267 start_codon:yes stop_codon:yes gene_type:complete